MFIPVWLIVIGIIAISIILAIMFGKTLECANLQSTNIFREYRIKEMRNDIIALEQKNELVNEQKTMLKTENIELRRENIELEETIFHRFRKED